MSSATLLWPPVLENGDRLPREEFERRYDAMPGLQKAELLEGVVYMPSPVRQRGHSNPHGRLVTWLGLYEGETPGVELGDNASIRLGPKSMPQPDGFLIIDPACGGQTLISEDDYVVGGPELIAEVAASTASIDLHIKLPIYRRHGVREFIVWRVLDRAVDWFVLRGKQYQRLAPGRSGVYKSRVFPGLWLDGAALVSGRMPKVYRVLQNGLATREHSAFVARLRKAKRT